MKYGKVTVLCAMAIAFLFTFTGCNFDESDNNLQGGVILDSEYISKIKEEILATEETTSEEKTESDETETVTNTEETEFHEDHSELQSETSASETESETHEEIGKEVYWTANGGVWHLYRDCGHLKNSAEVISGSQEDAIETGKKNVCATCNAKYEKNLSDETESQ